MQTKTPIATPAPLPDWPDGAKDRQVGIEVEFGDLSAEDAAAVVQRRLGGELRKQGPHRVELADTALGDFLFELDSRFVHPGADAGEFERTATELLGKVASAVVPTEMIAPPVAVDSIAEVGAAVDDLVAAGATGTEPVAYAFGLHLNIETPAPRLETILAILRAYLLVSPWLRRVIRPDATRTVLPFIAPFPDAYRDRVLRPDYKPDMGGFIRDYCAANPDKNRELDLLPLLNDIDPDAVESALGAPYETARPTFHYRLPDARPDDPGWSIAGEWNRWVAIERLAADPQRLQRLMDKWQAMAIEKAPPERWIGFVEAEVSA